MSVTFVTLEKFHGIERRRNYLFGFPSSFLEFPALSCQKSTAFSYPQVGRGRERHRERTVGARQEERRGPVAGDRAERRERVWDSLRERKRGRKKKRSGGASSPSSDCSLGWCIVVVVFFIIGFEGWLMGASLTSLTDGNGGSLKPGLRDIPESCVAAVFMYLNPPEICKLARLNRSFRNAASADFVWESKLPANYRYLLAKLFPDPLDSLSKKEIFAVLSRPHPFDSGSKEVWLEKATGAVCLAVSSRAMTITGIDDRRYWNFILTDESRFHEIAYLQQVWWFEVDGEFDFQYPAGTYSLFFRLQLGRPTKRLGRRVCNFDHVHGWDLKPVRFQLSTSEGQHASCQCFLEDPEKNGNEGITKHIRGNWMNYHVGDFVVSSSNIPTKIKFSMTQIDCTHSKGGLCVDCVLIYPCNFTKKGKYF